jgi:hypothetical protein
VLQNDASRARLPRKARLAATLNHPVLALPVFPEPTQAQREHVVSSVLEFYGARVG